MRAALPAGMGTWCQAEPVMGHWAAEAMMPGMKVTLNTAMRVRDVSRPSPQHEDNARAKVAEWPASRARPAPAPPPARGRKGGPARPWRPGADRGEASTSRTGGGPRKGQGRPAPPPQGTGQRPAPGPPDAAQRPWDAAPAPQQPPALPSGHDEAHRPVPDRGKRVRRRRRRGQPGG